MPDPRVEWIPVTRYRWPGRRAWRWIARWLVPWGYLGWVTRLEHVPYVGEPVPLDVGELYSAPLLHYWRAAADGEGEDHAD